VSVKRINSGHGHRYTIDGARAEGVTTVLAMINKDLTRWAAGVVADYVIRYPELTAQMVRSDPGGARQFLTNLPVSTRNAAATRGTIVHRDGDRIAHGEEVEVADEYLPFVLSYVDFLNLYRPTIIQTEMGVASRAYGHGGTTDGIMEFPPDLRLYDGSLHPLAGLRALFDVKTGKYLWEKDVLQVTAYRFSDTCIVDDEERDMPGVDVVILIHVRDDGFEVVPVTANLLQYQAFVALVRAYRALRAAGMEINGNGLKGTPDLLLEPYPDPRSED
jgi:hypothetical protein